MTGDDDADEDAITGQADAEPMADRRLVVAVMIRYITAGLGQCERDKLSGSTPYFR
jgi:hypothetical protein